MQEQGQQVPTEPTVNAAASRKSSRSRWMVVGILLLLVAGAYALGLHDYLWESVRANLDNWEAQVQQHLLPAVVVFFLIYVAVTALSLPVAVILSLLAGALFGRWLGTGIVSLASTCGATLAFLLSRYLLRDWVQARFGSRLEPINRGVEQSGAFYLFSLRLVPVIPFWLINLGMGLTSLRVTTFAWVSWLGMLLGTFLYVNVGTDLRTLKSPENLLSPQILLGLALLGIVPLALRKIIRWRS